MTLHDGSRHMLHKLDQTHDPRDPDAALMTIRKRAAHGELATGLLYIDESQHDLHDILNTSVQPLNAAPMTDLCPGSAKLDSVNARFR